MSRIPVAFILLGFIVVVFALLTIVYYIGAPLFTILGNFNAVINISYFNQLFVFADWGIVAIIFCMLFLDLFESYEKPTRKNALINLGSLLVLGWVWSFAVFGLNTFVPFYKGATPYFFAIISSGYIPFILAIFLMFSIVFNLRPSNQNNIIINNSSSGLSEGIH